MLTAHPLKVGKNTCIIYLHSVLEGRCQKNHSLLFDKTGTRLVHYDKTVYAHLHTARAQRPGLAMPTSTDVVVTHLCRI